MSLTVSPTILVPTELVIKMLKCLDGISLAKCRQTCKYFRNLIDDTTSLQYEIELAINLKEDGQYSSLSSLDKLKALRDHQKAWDTFEWKHDKSIPMVRGRAWEFFGNVLAQQDDAGWFTFRQLPSKYRGIEEKEWRAKPDLPRVKVFGMDPSQNLLVLIERPRGSGANLDNSYRLHLRTMSNCTKHPLAQSDILVHSQKFLDQYLSYSCQVSGDNVGVQFHVYHSDGQSEVIIWNWKTGEKKLHLIGDDIQSFCFLSERHVILGIIFTIPSGDESTASLLVVDFESEPGEAQHYGSARHCCTLLLPLFSHSVWPERLIIRTGTTPTPDPELQVPFNHSRLNHLCVASLEVENSDEERHCVVLCVPQGTILSLLPLAALDSGPRQLRWDQWGPKGTRFVYVHPDRSHSPFWDHFCYGANYITKQHSDRTDISPMILLYDFNQRALPRDPAFHDTDNLSDLPELERLKPNVTLMVTKPSVIQGIFEEDVETCLPYRVRTAPLPWNDVRCALMCNEDAIVVAAPHQKEYCVLTF